MIPARGGSKGIARKNVREIAGKPLIQWTIESALNSRADAVVVSTEDEEIASVARDAGAEVPFMRPEELAADSTPGIAPVLHAIDQLPAYDAVMLLQPTSPLRTAQDIDAVLDLAQSGRHVSVVSVSEPDHHPAWTYRLDEAARLVPLMGETPAARRQDLPPIFSLNGAIYFAVCDWLRTGKRLVAPETLGYVMPRERSIDIDTVLDWRIAEMLLKDRA